MEAKRGAGGQVLLLNLRAVTAGTYSGAGALDKQKCSPLAYQPEAGGKFQGGIPFDPRPWKLSRVPALLLSLLPANSAAALCRAYLLHQAHTADVRDDIASSSPTPAHSRWTPLSSSPAQSRWRAGRSRAYHTRWRATCKACVAKRVVTVRHHGRTKPSCHACRRRITDGSNITAPCLAHTRLRDGMQLSSETKVERRRARWDCVSMRQLLRFIPAGQGLIHKESLPVLPALQVSGTAGPWPEGLPACRVQLRLWPRQHRPVGPGTSRWSPA